MKVMVTGASGNVGKYVLERLIAMGEQVVAAGTGIDKLNACYGKNKKITTVYFDFTDQSTFENALKDVDRVFLMRPPHLGKPEDLFPFIQKLKDSNIKLVTFLSLMGVENNPIPPHHKIEKYIIEQGIPFSHIRPGFFMQNISGIHSPEIQLQNKIFIPAGRSKTSFIDAKDIGLSAATILHNYRKHQNTAYTITGPRALDYYQVAEILTNVTGRKITYANPSFLKYRKIYIKERGLDKGYVNVTVMLYFMTRMGTAKHVTYDFEKLTGKKPRTFEEFAKDNVSAFN